MSAALRPGRRWAATLAAAIGAAWACGTAEAPPAEAPRLEPLALAPVEALAGAGAQAPFLYAAPDGRLLATWLEPDPEPSGDAAETWRLRLGERTGDGWQEPRTVARRDAFFVNWADFPSVLAMRDGTLLVHWLEKMAPDTYAYHVMLSLSRDDGDTWTDPVPAHRDLSPTEHGFVSAARWGEEAALAWLDGREMGGAGHAEPAGDMTLRYRTVAADGALGPERLLDGRTCECCQTAMARTRGGLVVAYRGRSAEDVRDIQVVRYDGEGWTEPAAVHRDGWHIPGCPVNGPQLAASGDRLAVAWYAAPEGEGRVQVAFSEDGGASWSAPLRVDEGRPIGRVDVEFLPDGSAAAVWVEAGEEGAAVLLRRVAAEGARSAAVQVSATSAARASGFPRMARSSDGVAVAWTLPGENGGVRFRAAALPRAP